MMLKRFTILNLPSLFMPVLAAVIAIAIFVVDTVTPLDIAVAVLYVAVVLLSVDFTGRRGVMLVAAGCAALTVLSFLVTHWHDPSSGPMLRTLVSLVAIAITAVLAVRNQRTTEELRKQASLLDLTHDTVFVRDHGDVIAYWNRAAAELYGWSREQALGRKVGELLETVFPAPVPEIMSELTRTGRWEGELVHTRRDGSRRVVDSRWALQRDGRGRPLAILETNTDITERRSAEDALHRAQTELAHVSRVATLGELTASIAHEVNQPLAAVVTNGEACLRWLGRDVPDLAEARSSVEHMIRNGRRASEVVWRLRALSRKADPLHLPINLGDVVDDALLVVRRELAGRRVVLAVAPLRGLPRIRGDRVQLQQVIINLLVNGAQAMDTVAGDMVVGGPRELSIAAARSTEPGETEDQIVVTIGDTGPGIPAENLDRLFEAFFTTRPDGMGMGLSICRSIIESHGGRIWATNRAGAGACFHFSVPIVAEGAA
jgi:two-component system, LuxR family, sensor kinase FixL